MDIRLPIPKTWQEFESICHQLWKEIWCDPNAQKNGRLGYPQHGVDVFGRPIYSSAHAGVQCKDKDERLGSKLSESELVAECDKATNFRPQLDAFTLATTAPRDPLIQLTARELTAENKYHFDVHVWSWDDIEPEITCRPQLLRTFYTNFPFVDQSAVQTIKLSVSAPRDQLFSFFARPRIVDNLHPTFRDRFAQVFYELSDNAFLHGKAMHFQLSFDGTVLRIEDDGAPFNPLVGLDPNKSSAKSHIGSYVVDEFRRTFKDFIGIEYSRINAADRSLNVLEFAILQPATELPTPEVVDIPVNVGQIGGRRAAGRLAQSITLPIGAREIILTVGTVHNLSALFEFISQMLLRLPADTSLTVSLPRTVFYPGMNIWFNDDRLSIRPR
jgi:hypothetical protein